jgi:hypothetical protein
LHNAGKPEPARLVALDTRLDHRTYVLRGTRQYGTGCESSFKACRLTPVNRGRSRSLCNRQIPGRRRPLGPNLRSSQTSLTAHPPGSAVPRIQARRFSRRFLQPLIKGVRNAFAVVDDSRGISYYWSSDHGLVYPSFRCNHQRRPVRGESSLLLLSLALTPAWRVISAIPCSTLHFPGYLPSWGAISCHLTQG